MGTTQSKASTGKEGESQFEKVLDLFCANACPCQPMQDPSKSGLNLMFPSSSHFNLNLLHPSTGPYLGASLWEPIAIEDKESNVYEHEYEHEHDKENNAGNDNGDNTSASKSDTDSNDGNMLNISHYPAADQEFQPLPSPHMTMTPPRCVELNISHEHESNPSFLLLKKSSSFSSPLKYRRSRTHENADSNAYSGCSARENAKTLAECYSENGVEATISDGGSDVKITRNFVPRKLFDSQDQDNTNNISTNTNTTDDHDHEVNDNVGPLHRTNQAFKTGRRSRIAAESTPPPPPPLPQYMNSPCKSIDQSIVMRNGVLVQQTRTQLPSSQSPTSTITCPNLSPSRVSNRYIPDGLERNNMLHINTLPSFKDAHPIRLIIKESYQGYETQNVSLEQEGGTCTGKVEDSMDMNANANNTSNVSLLSDAEQACFFSYDPYFSLGQYIISTLDGGQYGNGLSVKMGERYMTLQDRNKRVWGVMRSRHTWIPSAVIYSPTPRYPSQTPSSHRPCGEMDGNCHLDADGVELYPWALVKKHGRRMDHDVSIHMVAKKKKVSVRSRNDTNVKANINSDGCGDLVGGLFDKQPMFRSRHGFDGWDNHQHTVVNRINNEDKEVPCCIMMRNQIQRDVFDITIAPGIDPLMIICYMAVHSKMDVEPKLSDL